VTGGEEQSNRWDELHKPDQAKPERAVGESVHLPADCDGLDLKCNRGGNPHIKKLYVWPMVKEVDIGLAIGGHYVRFISGACKFVSDFRRQSAAVRRIFEAPFDEQLVAKLGGVGEAVPFVDCGRGESPGTKTNDHSPENGRLGARAACDGR